MSQKFLQKNIILIKIQRSSFPNGYMRISVILITGDSHVNIFEMIWA